MLGDPLTDLSLRAKSTTSAWPAIDTSFRSRSRFPVPKSRSPRAKAAPPLNSQFIGQLRDEHSKLMGVVRDGIKIKLADSTAAQLASRPIAYDTGFTVPSGNVRAEVPRA